MIPEIRIPAFSIWKLEFHAFGILVGFAILLGAYLAAERADRAGLSRRRMNDLALWMLAGGFLLAHLVAVIFYHPQRIREDPWVLLQVWNGISSVGGFFGGLFAFLAYLRYYRLPRMPYGDVCAYAMSWAWIFGRMGCATAHDHKGSLTDFPLAVAFKGGARHD
ncbi:MAG: prolipoprotein diacylglyceryl transferase, partial [Deltaproteobacteria bacterium]|nr:prolipoprotein diacylglyceryl transferase [Deltaproteobacteria bacterium]